MLQVPTPGEELEHRGDLAARDRVLVGDYGAAEGMFRGQLEELYAFAHFRAGATVPWPRTSSRRPSSPPLSALGATLPALRSLCPRPRAALRAGLVLALLATALAAAWLARPEPYDY